MMFEQLMRQGARRAERAAAERREALAARLVAAAPRGVKVSVEPEAVVLSGPDLARRAAIDPELRWLVAEARDE